LVMSDYAQLSPRLSPFGTHLERPASKTADLLPFIDNTLLLSKIMSAICRSCGNIACSCHLPPAAVNLELVRLVEVLEKAGMRCHLVGGAA
jgi:hypothetical protein